MLLGNGMGVDRRAYAVGIEEILVDAGEDRAASWRFPTSLTKTTPRPGGERGRTGAPLRAGRENPEDRLPHLVREPHRSHREVVVPEDRRLRLGNGRDSSPKSLNRDRTDGLRTTAVPITLDPRAPRHFRIGRPLSSLRGE